MFVLCLGLYEFGLLSDWKEGASWVIKSSSMLLKMGSYLMQVMNLSWNQLLELTLCFFPQCFWSSWSRDLLLERLETLLTLPVSTFPGLVCCACVIAECQLADEMMTCTFFFLPWFSVTFMSCNSCGSGWRFVLRNLLKAVSFSHLGILVWLGPFVSLLCF